MSRFEHEDDGKVLFVHRTAIFDRNLEDLRRKGGAGSMAAAKAEAVIRQIMGMNEWDLRKQFRFTRRGEYRIKYCGKYELGCGHRLVFIRRSGHIVFLYVGSHDDCFRWIERNRGLTYEFDGTPPALQIAGDASTKDESISDDGKEDLCVDEYEAHLMSRIDERTLQKIFSGFAKI